MSRRSKIILIVLALFIAITVLRETGVVSANYYRYTIHSSTRYHGDNNSIMYDGSCSDPTGSHIPISIEYEGHTFREEPETDPEFRITLSNTNSGPGWMPLYKNVHFSADATYICMPTLKDKKSGQCKNITLSGQITITGNIRAIGFCSWREVKQMITNNLIGIVKETGRGELKKL